MKTPKGGGPSVTIASELLSPGYLAAVLHYGAQPAREVRALRR